MKVFISLVICLTFFNSFSQDKWDKMPANTNKIIFCFEKKSNYSIVNNNVYADTLLFKIDFPDLKRIIARHPSDSLKICSFVPVNQFIGDNKAKLKGILYHNNETIIGTFDRQKNKTILKCSRDDANTKEVFEKHFGEKYEKFRYTIEVNYTQKKVYYSYPLTRYVKEFKELSNNIAFLNDDDLNGHYLRQTKLFLEDNVVEFDSNLNDKINIDVIFNNARYGLKKHQSVFSTIDLKSVKYE